MLKLIALAALLCLYNAPAHALEVGDAAPCVVLNHLNVDGTESNHCIRQPDVAGRPVILEFFSVFCSDCQANLPNMTRLAEDLQGQGTVRQIGLDRDEKAIRTYVQDNRAAVRFSVALDTDRDATHAYGVHATPTIFVLDSTEHIIYKHEGVLAPADMTAIENLTRNAQ